MSQATMVLLPPQAHLCQVCGVGHQPDMPHSRNSIYYTTAFNMQHGRSPTWHDALAHCSDETKAFWIKALSDQGVNCD
jgi:hypothetical protein